MDFRELITSLHVEIILPETLLLVSLLVAVGLDLVLEKQNPFVFWIPFFGLFGSVFLLIIQSRGLLESTTTSYFDTSSQIAFVGSFQGDAFSLLFRIFLAFSAGFTFFLSSEYIEKSGTAKTEFACLLATATLGGMFLAGANDLANLFISLETLSLASYLLTGYTKRDLRSNESALKYLLIGAASSSFFLYGASWLYGLSGGHLEFHALLASLLTTNLTNSGATWIAFLLVTIGIGFKLSAAPFHQWTPDVYQGSPTPIVAFLSVTSKAAGLALATRILTLVFPYLGAEWHFLFEILAILSMGVGNLVALTQTSVKRMLGYSSVGQAGFLMIGLLTGEKDGYASMLIYLLIYLCMNIGAFAGAILFGLRTGTDQIKDLSGLFRKDPWLASGLSIAFLSLGGIPPLAGFFGKLYLFWAGWQAGFFFLIFFGLVTSVISIYYYLRIVKIMFVTEKKEIALCLKTYKAGSFSIQNPLQFGMGACTLGSLLLGIFLNPMITFVNESIAITPYLQETFVPITNLVF